MGDHKGGATCCQMLLTHTAPPPPLQSLPSPNPPPPISYIFPYIRCSFLPPSLPFFLSLFPFHLPLAPPYLPYPSPPHRLRVIKPSAPVRVLSSVWRFGGGREEGGRRVPIQCWSCDSLLPASGGPLFPMNTLHCTAAVANILHSANLFTYSTHTHGRMSYRVLRTTHFGLHIHLT